jgi:hypothetical protein
VSVWQQLTTTTLLLVGTLEPLAIDVDALAHRLEAESFAGDVALMGLHRADGAGAMQDALREGAKGPGAGRAEGLAMANRFLSFFLLGDEGTRALVASYEPVRDDRTLVDYSIPRFVGSGFGFSLYTHSIGTPSDNPNRVMRERFREYASWADPAGLIVPDAAQAEGVNDAILERQELGRAAARPRRR